MSTGNESTGRATCDTPALAWLRQAMQEAFNSRTAWTFSVPCAMKSIKLLENKAQLSLQRCQRSSLCLGSLRCISR